RVHNRLRQLDGVLLVRLGLAQPMLAALASDPNPLQSTAQPPLAGIEVEVAPLKAEQLALSHAEHQRANEKRFILVSLGRFQQSLGLVGLKEPCLPARRPRRFGKGRGIAIDHAPFECLIERSAKDGSAVCTDAGLHPSKRRVYMLRRELFEFHLSQGRDYVQPQALLVPLVGAWSGLASR